MAGSIPLKTKNSSELEVEEITDFTGMLRLEIYWMRDFVLFHQERLHSPKRKGVFIFFGSHSYHMLPHRLRYWWTFAFFVPDSATPKVESKIWSYRLTVIWSFFKQVCKEEQSVFFDMFFTPIHLTGILFSWSRCSVLEAGHSLGG